MKEDYCSNFPEQFRGDNIQPCCKQHDNDCGQRGSYNPYQTMVKFWKCLKENGVHAQWRLLIVTGGTLGHLVKYPYLAYTIYKYRKGGM